MANHILPIFCLLVVICLGTVKSLNQVATTGWKFEEPITFEDNKKRDVVTIACDDELIVTGISGWDGEARVYDIGTQELKYTMRCNMLQDMPAPFSYDSIQVSLGKKVIGTISSNDGTVSIFDRKDGTLLYQRKHHGDWVEVSGIEVTDDYVLTGAEDGSLVFMENIAGEWKITHKAEENKDQIIHIAADGKWAVTGHMKNMKLWDLEERKLVEMANPVPVKPVWMVTFNYPYAFAIGGYFWNGVQVWDMERGVQIRHILKDEKPYQYIHSNGQLLTFEEHVSSWISGDDDDRMLKLGVYDVKQLADPEIITENLWSKTFEYPGDYLSKRVRAASNKDSLIVDHRSSKFDIIKFEKED